MASVNADLGLSLDAAANDPMRRECPWYEVWNTCLTEYVFAHSNTETTACSTIPQYSLVWTYDVDVDIDVDDSTSNPSSPDSNRSSPPPGRLSKRSVKIPDFVQVLRRATRPQPSSPPYSRQRVILTVEVKPAVEFESFGSILDNQVAKQVMYAFANDRTLESLGVVLACGLYWGY
ncbi:hypothetical protein BDR07DRAFT_1411124 [Suillus spraguei]|nr:hypothetical protein BDR07DRAFT_1411124 [Suillus spraguei]